MRLLLQNAPPEWTRGLSARGHALTLADTSRRGLVGELSLGLKSLGTSPVDACLAFMPTPRALGPLAAGLRAPLVAHFDHFEGCGPVERLRFQLGLQRARAVTASSEETARQLGVHVGLGGVTLIRPGFDLADLPLLERAAARAALGLDEGRRVFVLAGPLIPDVRVDVLALAHRKMPGAALLVVASGPQLPVVRAMTVATRPSSPVIILPEEPEALGAALGAADVGLALARERFGMESELYAAAGLVQVAYPHPELEARGYPRVVPADSSDAALGAAMASAFERGGVDPEDAARFRAQLGPDRPYVEMERLLKTCASPSSSQA